MVVEKVSASDAFLQKVRLKNRQRAPCWRFSSFTTAFVSVPMSLSLQSTDFELFDVPACFEQQPSALDARWKELQREAHPDRFAAQGGAAQRVAMQWSVRINEAYQRLKEPLKRAAYLCEIHNAPIRAEDNTAMPGPFLQQQMEWREALDDAHSLQQIDALASDVEQAQLATLARCGELIDRARDFQAAAQQVRALMFIERFAQSVADRQDQLGQ